MFLFSCTGSVYSTKVLIQDIKKEEIISLEITAYSRYVKRPPFPESIWYVKESGKTWKIDLLTKDEIELIHEFLIKLANYKVGDIQMPGKFDGMGFVNDSNFFFISLNLSSELYDELEIQYGCGDGHYGFLGGKGLGFPYTILKGTSKFTSEVFSFDFAPDALEFFNYFLNKYNKQENTDYPLVIMPEEYKMYIKKE
jgi:hypothetical protein